MNPFAHDRRFDAGHCLQCGQHNDGVSGHEIDPFPGALMVCASCSYIAEWDGEKMVELSAELMKELAEEDHPEIREALAATRLYQATKGVGIVVLEELPPEICQECGKLEELRPYGRRQANGVRKWVCMSCADKDPAEAARAFEERLEGKNPV